ncbi:MAG TPA: arginine--tRNA ligase [Candidatus Absconditabacterales bacterium]|nr:arginine--tRNA ligase [Candidatus Absconditabacterales bacterium]HMT26670.1 arginine--tRNA ligase [Candidatus Absconditabacterales bacterium]
MEVGKLKYLLENINSEDQEAKEKQEIGGNFSYKKTEKNIEKSNYPIVKGEESLRKLLKSNNIKLPEDNIIQAPKLAGPDFTLAVKEIFDLNKERYEVINQCSDELEKILKNDPNTFRAKIEKKGIFINIFCGESFFQDCSKFILAHPENYGTIKKTNPKNIIVEYSSPNMAKQMTIGHLRSTIIGDMIQKTLSYMGENILKRNYLGDRGTPFGKLIYSLLFHYQKDGDTVFKELEANPTATMGKLYSAFKDIEDEEKGDKARLFFQKLENGNKNLYEIWLILRELTLIDFDQVYKRLGTEFDTYLGEAFIQQYCDEIFSELKEKNFIIEDQGANIIKLIKHGQGENSYYKVLKASDSISEEDKVEILLIKKSDGASLYSLRDIALTKIRTQKILADEIIIFTGAEQNTHFAMIKAICEEMNYIRHGAYQHFGFGLILLDGKKMSSRQGKIKKLSDLLDTIQEKIITSFEEKIDAKGADKLGISALIFNDLKNDRIKDFQFDLEQMTKINGDTGIYLHYTNVRIKKLKEKIKEVDITGHTISVRSESEKKIIRKCGIFASILEKVIEYKKPHIFAQYILDICRDCNERYSTTPKIVEADLETQKNKKAIIETILITLNHGLNILRIPEVQEM